MLLLALLMCCPANARNRKRFASDMSLGLALSANTKYSLTTITPTTYSDKKNVIFDGKLDNSSYGFNFCWDLVGPSGWFFGPEINYLKSYGESYHCLTENKVTYGTLNINLGYVLFKRKRFQIPLSVGLGAGKLSSLTYDNFNEHPILDEEGNPLLDDQNQPVLPVVKEGDFIDYESGDYLLYKYDGFACHLSLKARARLFLSKNIALYAAFSYNKILTPTKSYHDPRDPNQAKDIKHEMSSAPLELGMTIGF